MSSGRRGLAAPWTRVAAMLAALPIAYAGSAFARDASLAAASRAAASAASLRALIAGGGVAVETVYFTDRHRAPVRVVRGLARPAPAALPPALPIPAGRTEIVSFGTGFADRVTIVRGMPATEANLERRIEKVTFADPREAAVTIVRGPSAPRDTFAIDLFGPANGGELDRVAFAVDGIESRHGADLRMWRPEPNGPQGPMQVSAAAALDVGGGDRFDLRQNRLLGRAYLAQMFRRYGNWADALAAYNWGPGNMDQWIAGGRNPDRLPPGVAWYVNRALRDALMSRNAAGL